MGRIRYVFVPASEERPDPLTACSRMLKEFGRGIQVAQNLLVIRCDPGAAPGIGRVVDELEHESILGCVAGDDTVIVVSKDSKSAEAVCAYLEQTGRLKLMDKERCILAYSGGLDTSALVPYMQEKFGYDIICALVDVGRMKDLESLRVRASDGGRRRLGGHRRRRRSSLTDFAFPALKANALYEGKYPLHSALSRPLISKKMVELAHECGAKFIAHGCTAKGNDQVRIDVSIRCLDPIHHRPGPGAGVGHDPAAADRLPGRAGHRAAAHQEEPVLHRREPLGPGHRVRRAGGPLGRRPDDAYQFTVDPKDAPDEPQEVVVSFEARHPGGRSTARPWARWSWWRRSTRSAARTASAGSTWSRTGWWASRAARPTRWPARWRSSWPTGSSRT